MRKNSRRMLTVLLIGIGVVLTALLGFLLIGRGTVTENVEYGVTFSRPYAEELGLDAEAALIATLDDLGVRRFRIPAYWSELETSRDIWNFRALDRQIDLIERRGGTIILAIGEKAPRWPECWTPDWWKDLPRDEQKERTLLYIETIMTRYRDRKAVVAWQIENEAHFAYGECPTIDRSFFEEEVARARSVDPSRPITTTDSGELSLWISYGKNIDALGVSTYRVVRSPVIGVWRYWFIPPFSYARKAALVRPWGPKTVYVSEFQMEPWNATPLQETPIEDQFETFDIQQMRANLRFAERMGLSPIDFWGVEWWYWMKETQNQPEFWKEMKSFLDTKKADAL